MDPVVENERGSALKALASFLKSLAWQESCSRMKLQIINFLKKMGSIVAGAWLTAFA